MSFESTTIKSIVNGIIDREYVLPAIQRQFVWDPERIYSLFDSIMRGYPIGSFLFWKIKKETVKKFKFYNFIIDYQENSRIINDKIKLSGRKGITAVLDGQKRLTSLLIGLKGSYQYKRPRINKDNPNAYKMTNLYLNLLDSNDDAGYKFLFLSNEELEESEKSEKNLWYKKMFS